MKKLVSVMLAAAMVLSMAACSAGSSSQSGSSSAAETKAAETEAATTVAATTEMASMEETEPAGNGESVEVIVFAAASMTETLTEIAELYKAVAPNVTLTFNFDSSGTLKTQITEDAECDLFISAAPKQMNQLDSTSDTFEGTEYVLQGTRINLLENKVTLVVPEGNPFEIESYDDLVAAFTDAPEGFLFAMGNSDVPVGQYTQKIFAYYDLDEEALAADGLITYGSNVKEVTTQVSEASVAAGVVYATDAFSAGLEVVDEATPEMCGQVIYPAAVMANAAHPEEAQAFLDYLATNEDAKAVFENVGFTVLGE